MRISGDVSFFCDEDEFSGVKKIAGKVCCDVELVTGKKPEVEVISAVLNTTQEKIAGSNEAVFFATLDKSPLAERLAAEEGLSAELSKINGKRECYIFAVKSNKIIILGSDKRGTIYGLFHISELLGVSPLVDWAGVYLLTTSLLSLKRALLLLKSLLYASVAFL